MSPDNLNSERASDSIANEWASETDSRNRYKKQVQYWLSQDSSNTGMLGGLDEIHEVESKFSLYFLKRVMNGRPVNRCVDVGAGIGRVTKNVLSQVFSEIHLVDPCEKFLQKAKEDISFEITIHPCLIQDFSFEENGEFDCWWVQWTLLYLNDHDAVSTLQKMAENLSEEGLIIVKDNVADDLMPDLDDFSVMRTKEQFEALFEKANLEVIFDSPQSGLSPDICEIHCWALQPRQT
ncbi:hypothetical protein PCE1_002592 [Barthelona sp. PCE]